MARERTRYRHCFACGKQIAYGEMGLKLVWSEGWRGASNKTLLWLCNLHGREAEDAMKKLKVVVK